MRFTPISEQEADAAASGLWKAGPYDFEIAEASEKTSNAGNDMFALEVMIFDTNGNRKKVFDYLVQNEKSAWKIRHFAASCGLLPQYEGGTLITSEIVGRTGKCQIGTQSEKDGYPPKNVVRDYVKAAASASRQISPLNVRKPEQSVVAANADLDDEIPF